MVPKLIGCDPPASKPWVPGPLGDGEDSMIPQDHTAAGGGFNLMS